MLGYKRVDCLAAVDSGGSFVWVLWASVDYARPTVLHPPPPEQHTQSNTKTKHTHKPIEVAKHTLDHCICGPLLRDRAVLLATHNLHTLERADQLLLLEGKRVAFMVRNVNEWSSSETPPTPIRNITYLSAATLPILIVVAPLKITNSTQRQ